MTDFTSPDSSEAGPSKASAPHKLEINGLCLLGAAAIGFLLVPHAREAHLAGTWFIIGWPLPTLDLKVGMIQMPGKWGLHPFFSWYGLMNVGVWVAVLLGVRWVARSGGMPRFLVAMIRVLIVIAVYASAVWLTYGISAVLDCLAQGR
jgi:hypothetical protein